MMMKMLWKRVVVEQRSRLVLGWQRMCACVGVGEGENNEMPLLAALKRCDCGLDRKGQIAGL